MHDYAIPTDISSFTSESSSQDTAPTRCNLATDGAILAVATEHEKPCLYQADPKLEWQLDRMPPNRTHSASINSRYRWAAKESAILDMNHREKPPQFIVTIQFREVKNVPEIRGYHENFSTRLRRWRKKNEDEDLALYLVREIDKSNKLHMHGLIQTSLANPEEVMRSIIERSSKMTASLSYCSPIENLAGATKYVVKHLAAR